MNTSDAPENKPENAQEPAAETVPDVDADAEAGATPAADAAAPDDDSGGNPGGEAGGDTSAADFNPSFGAEADGGEDGRVAMLEAEVADMKDKMLRAVAEQENVRRRAQKDIESAQRRSIKSFAGDMLAVADNLRRALDSIDEAARKDNPAIENLMIGVEMTERELMHAFERHGITQMQPVGQPFDPNFHEAMFEIPDEAQPAGTVGQVIETGYVIHGQPLRAAKVGVTKGGPKPEKQPEQAPAANAAEGDGGGDKSGYGAKDAGTGSHVDESL